MIERLIPVLVIVVLAAFVTGIFYILDWIAYKMAWKAYIQKCLEANEEPTMNLKEFAKHVNENIRNKHVEHDKQNAKYAKDVKKWMKKL